MSDPIKPSVPAKTKREEALEQVIGDFIKVLIARSVLAGELASESKPTATTLERQIALAKLDARSDALMEAAHELEARSEAATIQAMLDVGE